MTDNRHAVDLALAVVSYVALRRGDVERALDYAQRSLDHAVEVSIGVGPARITLANALLGAGRVREALDQANDGLIAALTSGRALQRAEAYRSMAWCHLLLNDWPTGLQCLLEQFRLIAPSGGETDVLRFGEAVTVGAIVLASRGTTTMPRASGPSAAI